MLMKLYEQPGSLQQLSEPRVRILQFQSYIIIRVRLTFADLKLLKMLTQLEPLKRHQDVKLPRSKGTGSWLLNLESFIEWQNTNTNTNTSTVEETGLSGHVFCCYGIPGAGKTVIRYVAKYSIIPIPVMSC